MTQRWRASSFFFAKNPTAAREGEGQIVDGQVVRTLRRQLNGQVFAEDLCQVLILPLEDVTAGPGDEGVMLGEPRVTLYDGRR